MFPKSGSTNPLYVAMAQVSQLLELGLKRGDAAVSLGDRRGGLGQ